MLDGSLELVPIGGQADDLAVARFERRIGARLPPDYRAFLLATNGGKPVTRRCFDFADRRGPYTNGAVRAFAGLGRPPHHDLERLFDIYCGGERRVPPEVIPIGDDAFGNLVCLAVTGAERGRVYFWDHEFECEPASYLNMDWLADSFAAFLDCLCRAEELLGGVHPRTREPHPAGERR